MPRYIGAYRGGVRPSAPTTVYRTCALSLPCHSEPVTDVTGVGIRPPFYASGGVLLPPAAKVPKNAVQTCGLKIPCAASHGFLSCQNKPRERCAVEISPKYCIVSASLFAAAFALKCGAVWFFVSWQDRLSNGGPWPPPTFAAKRQRRDLIIALTPGVRFPKGRGRDPSPLVVSRGLDL